MNIKLKKQIICFPYHLLNAILAMSLILLTDIEYNFYLYFFIWITLCTYDLTIARNYKKKYKQILYDTKPTRKEVLKKIKDNKFVVIDNKFFRIVYDNQTIVNHLHIEDFVSGKVFIWSRQGNIDTIPKEKAKEIVSEFLYKPETRIN